MCLFLPHKSKDLNVHDIRMTFFDASIYQNGSRCEVHQIQGTPVLS